MIPKNIYIVGASATGKTTLVNALNRYFASASNRPPGVPRPHIIHEVARPVLARLGFTRDHIGVDTTATLSAQEAILREQYWIERSILSQRAVRNPGDIKSLCESRQWFISDRSGFDGIVYTHMFVGPLEADRLMERPRWSTLEKNMKSGLVFLCEAGGPWMEDDQVRSLPKDEADWKLFDEIFATRAHERGIPYVVISKDLLDLAARVAFVAAAVKPLVGHL